VQIIGGAPGTAVAAATPKPIAADKALNMQALRALAVGANQQARDALSKAVALAADNPVLVFNLGVADLKLGQYAQASRSFNRARQLYETAANELTGKAKPYLDMDELPSGERPYKLMKALIRANSLLADTVTYQGKAREGLGESMDARRFFREAAGLYRKNAEHHKSLGDLYLKRNDIRNAVSEYAIAAKADPRYAEPWKALSLIAVGQKKEELANRYMAIYRRLSGG
jgi:tetratricopeptide (TPR) repeat protein